MSTEKDQQQKPELEERPKKYTYEISDVNKDYQFDDADFTIRSGDEVVFRVHSYQIMAFSRVFRDMILAGRASDQPQEVILTDKELEHSSNVSLFLDIAYGKPLVAPTQQDDFIKYDKLIPFILKYDAPSALELIRTSMHLWLTKGVLSPDQLFCAGCHIDDRNLTTSVLRNASGWKHQTPTSSTGNSAQQVAPVVSINDGIPGASVLDPTAMSLETFTRIPVESMFALLRASRKTGGILPPSSQWSLVADEYERIMKEIYKPA